MYVDTMAPERYMDARKTTASRRARVVILGITLAVLLALGVSVGVAPAQAATRKPSKAAAKAFLVRKNPLGGRRNTYKVLKIMKGSDGSYWVILNGFHPGENAAVRMHGTYVTRLKGKKWRLVAGIEESPFDTETMNKFPRAVQAWMIAHPPNVHWDGYEYY